jgi:hypothetical protein
MEPRPTSFAQYVRGEPRKMSLDELIKKRVGILRRMTWQLPRDLIVKIIKPIFSAKLK